MMATNETGDTATTTMTTTAAAPCPCPVIPKSAMEIAAIIASTKITPMEHQQQQQQRSFPPHPGIAPATAPLLFLHLYLLLHLLQTYQHLQL